MASESVSTSQVAPKAASVERERTSGQSLPGPASRAISPAFLQAWSAPMRGRRRSLALVPAASGTSTLEVSQVLVELPRVHEPADLASLRGTTDVVGRQREATWPRIRSPFSTNVLETR